MQNDMLKNTIAPWQEKGRWYHGVWDISTHSWVTDETDALLLTYTPSVSSNIYYLYTDNSKHIAIDSKIVPRGKMTIGTSSNANSYRFATTGNSAIPIAPAGTDGILDVYIFIKEVG